MTDCEHLLCCEHSAGTSSRLAHSTEHVRLALGAQVQLYSREFNMELHLSNKTDSSDALQFDVDGHHNDNQQPQQQQQQQPHGRSMTVGAAGIRRDTIGQPMRPADAPPAAGTIRARKRSSSVDVASGSGGVRGTTHVFGNARFTGVSAASGHRGSLAAALNPTVSTKLGHHHPHHRNADWLSNTFEKMWRRLRHPGSESDLHSHHNNNDSQQTQHGRRSRRTSETVALNQTTNVTQNAHSASTLKSPSANDDKQLIDFGTTAGSAPRLITDPQEFSDFVNEESLRMQHFFRGTHVEGEEEDRVMRHNIYMIEPWFHYGLSRKQAEEAVKSAGQQDGSYLVRTSETLRGRFVLSILFRRNVYHFPIFSVSEEDKTYLTIDNEIKFRDLAQLVDFYQLNRSRPLPCKLERYITKALNVPRYENTISRALDSI